MNLLLILALFASPQDTLELDWCYRAAVGEYPLGEEIRLQAMVADSKVKALQSNYLPQFAVRGDATYHSEVPDFATFPAAFTPPVISHDQYHVSLGAEQLVYDGGATARQKDMAAAEALQAQRQVEVELYQLRERVNQAFFNVLVLQAQGASLETLHQDIGSRLKLVTSQVEQGVLLQSNADILKVEKINVEQQIADTETRRLAALDVLGTFVGRRLDAETVLLLPTETSEAVVSNSMKRPEYALFESTKSTIQQQIGLTASKNYPKMAAFGDLSYGRAPGLNMFENSFTPYYAVGLRLSWKLWDWKANQRQRQALSFQQEIVDARQATFAKNIDLALQQQLRDVERLEDMIKRDEEIIALRKRVVEQSESQLTNGVITATEYMTELSAAHRAELTRDLHGIQLSQAHVQILTTIGEGL